MEKTSLKLEKLDTILITIVFGACFGIIISSLDLMSIPIFLIISGVLFCMFVFQRKYIGFFEVLLILFAIIFGYGRMEISKPDSSVFDGKVGESITIKAIVKNEPNEKYGAYNFVVKKDGIGINIRGKGEYIPKYGDELLVSGKLELPENFDTDQGKEFDYVSYLYKDDIFYKIENAKYEFVSAGHGNRIISSLISIKQFVINGFQRVFTLSEANLLAGLNLGEKSAIDTEFRDDLITTGTIHIIALSGYNVTIIVNAMRDFFAEILGLSVRVASYMGVISVVLFVLLTGLQSSAVRAGIMAIITIYSRMQGKPYNAFRALIFAGFLMLMFNPKYLVYDVSFQLSFLATLGIIFITPILERKFARVPKKFLYIIPLREALAVTLGAQIGVYPYIVYKMGTLSIISLPANILILPAIPFAMGFGMLAGVLGAFSEVLGFPFVYITHYLLLYIENLVRFFASIPFASFSIEGFSGILCLIFYIGISYFVYKGWNTIQKPHD